MPSVVDALIARHRVDLIRQAYQTQHAELAMLAKELEQYADAMQIAFVKRDLAALHSAEEAYAQFKLEYEQFRKERGG